MENCVKCGNLISKDAELMFVNRCFICGMQWTAIHGSNEGIENDLGDD